MLEYDGIYYIIDINLIDIIETDDSRECNFCHYLLLFRTITLDSSQKHVVVVMI